MKLPGFVVSCAIMLFHINVYDCLEYYGIGAMVSSTELQQAFNEAIDEVNTSPTSYGLASSVINGTSYLLHSNPINATKDLCRELISKGVYIVISSNQIDTTHGPSVVSYACAFYNIPVIGISTRDVEFSDKSVHCSFLRTLSSYVEEANAWLSIVKYFRWSKMNLLTMDDNDSKRAFVRFTSLAYQSSITIEYPIMIPRDKDNVTSYLRDLTNARSNVIIFCGGPEDAKKVFRDAAAVNLTSSRYIWLISERALTGDALQYAPQGALVVKDIYEADPLQQMKEAVKVASIALGYMHRIGPQMTKPPSSCNDPGSKWNSGVDLYKRLLNTTLNTEPNSNATLQFDLRGDRINTPYSILNIDVDTESGNRTLRIVGHKHLNSNLQINVSRIEWPGHSISMPHGTQLSNHLKVVTVESHPFVYIEKMPADGNCSSLNTFERGKLYQYIPCFGPAPSFSGENHCCKGFCIDLLSRLADRINFTFSLHLIADGNFGSLERVNGSHVKKWNGMIGDIVEGKADMIVASLSITNERAQYIEFSKPFKYQGIVILVDKKVKNSSLDSFLRPFRTELWLLVLLSVHVVAVILYLLDRFSPFGRYHRSKTVKEETALNLSSAMWFSWGVLLNSGIGEGTPRSFSARVLSMVWAGFAMIIVASYTANLAAFLVLEKPKQVVSGIDDPNLRNPAPEFPYATVANSSVSAYFRRQVELSTMYTFMETQNVKTEQEGIEKVISGELKAFLWDSPVLYHTVSKECSLTTVGELFGRSGYGIGMPKGSPWSEEVSLSILNFHESGIMEELESMWINFGECATESTTTTTLGLEHMIGVFIMVAAGIGAGIVIVIAEVLYYKQKGWRQDQDQMMQKATDRWQERLAEVKLEKAKRTVSGNSNQYGGDHLEIPRRRANSGNESNGRANGSANGNGGINNTAYEATL